MQVDAASEDIKQDVLIENLNSAVAGSTGSYARPFGFVPTAGLPQGFMDSRWGDSLDVIKSRLGSSAKEFVRNGYKVLHVREETREVEYSVSQTDGLFFVGVSYQAGKEQQLADALVRKFGKVPEQNMNLYDEAASYCYNEMPVMCIIGLMITLIYCVVSTLSPGKFGPGLHLSHVETSMSVGVKLL
jgi:hypothetical protein